MDAEMEDTIDDMEIHGQEDETYDSSFSSPVGLSNGENLINTHAGEPDVQQEDQEKGNFINDTTRSSSETDIDTRSWEENSSTYDSPFSSPVGLSSFDNSINTHVGETDVQIEDQGTGNSENDTTSSPTETDSSYSSPVRVSSPERSITNHTHEPGISKEDREMGNSLNDTIQNSNATDIGIRVPEEDNSAYNSSSSSPVQISMSKNAVSTLTGEPDSLKEDQENGTFLNDTLYSTDMDKGGHKMDCSIKNNPSSSAVKVSMPANSKNDHAGEPDHENKYPEKGNSENDATLDSTSTDIDTSGKEVGNSTAISALTYKTDTLKEDNEKIEFSNDTILSSTSNDIKADQEKDSFTTKRSPVRLSIAEKSINALAFEPDTEKEAHEKIDFLDATMLSSTSIDVKTRDQENDSCENSTNPLAFEPDPLKEYDEKSIFLNDATHGSTLTDVESSDQEDNNSISNRSPGQFLNSDNAVNSLACKPDNSKVENEKSNFIIDATIDSMITNVEKMDQTKYDSTANRSPVQLSDSENSINSLTCEPDTPKDESEKSNLFNETTFNSVSTNVATRVQEEDNYTDFRSPVWISNSEDSNNALSSDPDTQEEDDEKSKFIGDVTQNSNADESEVFNNVIDDTEPSSETITVKHEPAETMEMKPKDISVITSNEDDGEIGESSSSKETGFTRTDTEDATSNKEAKSLVLYQNPKVDISRVAWTGKDLVLTRFVKFNSLYTVSNIFRHLSKRKSRDNDTNEKDKNISEVNSSEKVRKPQSCPSSLSLIRTAHENSQGNRVELDDVALESPELKAIKGRIVLYTKLWCKSCKEVRIFLRRRSLRYSEINIDVYPSRKVELEEITGSSDVPKVFFNQDLIGGLNELKALDESGQLEEKIEFVTSEIPTPKAPLPPFSGEDDVSSRSLVDELALIVKKMKESIVVKDRFYKFRRVTNCFLGSDAVDFLSEDQFLERQEAIEFARKLARELFFRHVLEENIFEDGNHLYRFLDHDPIISQCQNIPRGIILLKRQPLAEISYRLRFLLYAILDAYTSEDGKHVAYRTIHGSEEFARYLRIAEELQRLDLNRTAKEERLAFFINLYNLMAIHAILVWGHPEGAFERRKLLSEFKYVIGGRAYSLSDIHNGVLRSNQRAPYTLTRPFRINDKRFKVSLPYPEPLINFALVSGNRSAPALRCYSPKTIDSELMEAARNFIRSGAFVLQMDSMTVSVNKILKWYSVDFGKNVVEVLKHASNYLEVEKARTLLELLANSTELKVVYQPYDWRLNS
uniref:uncharacterized protein LOC122609101 n=1 Tax=Erigeron canadensis TaxID=72917 RepID=UPI001CB986AA|nr:uncharacterized protein LOC122609101 [Erigeron canadensis]